MILMSFQDKKKKKTTTLKGQLFFTNFLKSYIFHQPVINLQWFSTKKVRKKNAEFIFTHKLGEKEDIRMFTKYDVV